MREFISKLINSLDTTNTGFSGRKLSALFGILTCIAITFKYTNPDNLEGVLTIWLLFIAACLGMITAEQIISYKNGTPVENKTID